MEDVIQSFLALPPHDKANLAFSLREFASDVEYSEPEVGVFGDPVSAECLRKLASALEPQA